MNKLNIIERKIKKSIKNIFIKFGYQILKIQKEIVSSKIVKRKIGNFYLTMREDHQLPIFLKYQPYYSQNLPRLAMELHKKYPNLRMIDIGANIGDTVALMRSECFFPITCIDGDTDFFGLLKENIKQFKDVEAFNQLLGEKDETVQDELKKSIETARLQSGKSNSYNKSVSVITLDHFIKNHEEVKQSKLLKIDTDGYDMKIIRGAINYIKNTKPVIFLEYDPIFFTEQGDNGVKTLMILESLGYDDIIFYDNLGKLIISSNLSNHIILKQMNNYIDPEQRTPFPYYDIAVFHRDDKDVAKKFIEKEMSLFYSGKNYAQ